MTIIEEHMVRLLQAVEATNASPSIGEILIDAIRRAQILVAADRLRYDLAREIG